MRKQIHLNIYDLMFLLALRIIKVDVPYLHGTCGGLVGGRRFSSSGRTCCVRPKGLGLQV